MKIKFPKSIKIGSEVFKVKTDKKRYDADFDFSTSTITIGVKEKNKNHLFNIISHELFEVWACTLYFRYTRPDTFKTYEFHLDHRQFTNWVELATQSINEFIK